MSKCYVKIWEKYHDKKLPKNMEIHHIDGDRKNNSPENLLAVTIEKHLEIHKQQNDYGAVQAILIRMNLSDNEKQTLKENASKHQKLLWEKGNHNFQKISKPVRTEISRKVGLKTLENKVGIHAINCNHELAVENGRKAGKIAAKLKSGFLNVESENHGSKYVKNTYWWTNNSGERKRSNVCPGENWKKGMR